MTSTVGAAVPAQRAIGQSLAPRQLLTALAVTAAVLFALLAGHLVFRRLSGALVQPLGGLAIIAAAIGLAAGALALRLWLISQRSGRLRSRSHFAFRALWIAPGIASLVVLAALTLPGTPVGGAAVAWLVLLGSEAAGWLVFMNPSVARTRSSVALPATDTAQPDENEPELPAGLVQQMTRVRQDGGESVQALLHCQFAIGDRLSVAHLAFCPPLESAPKLTAHAIDNATAEVRITQAETFGARIEVRVPSTQDTTQGVVIEVLGSTTAPRDA